MPEGIRFRARHGTTHLGCFDTAVEAAVAYARHVGTTEEAVEEEATRMSVAAARSS